MAEHDDSEKTEDPTEQRREDFRKRGQVAQSRELASLLVMFGAIVIMWVLARFFLEQIAIVFSRSFTDYLIVAARDGSPTEAIQFASVKIVMVVGPIAGITWLLGAASSVFQVGLLNNEEALNFKLDKLDLVQGFLRIFSLRSIVEGVKATLKVVFLSVVMYAVLKEEIAQSPHVLQMDAAQLMIYIGTVVARMTGAVCVVMVVLAAGDYFYQRFELERQMRMTKQEVKEEIKSREGDPLIRARIRKLQREVANRRMMDDVKKASVVVTNPTHIAVALLYTKEMAAPKVIAKGADLMAERIKKIAKEAGIPTVENKPLARTMFKTLKIGQHIPRELYTAVAEVLSYIFRLKKQKSW
jgi:flagellar biosynthetic protein FlhB